ncbi:MAG: L-threonylcarbamoyladenylate synthase [Candidatus Falkowbacteria bacterium]
MIEISGAADELAKDDETIKKIVEVLQLGGVAALPTDTIYGLSCLADKANALERISQMKGREINKTFLLLIDSWEMAEEWAVITPEHKEVLQKVWPGPTTVILQAQKSVPFLVTAENTIALRWPADSFLTSLLSKLHAPLVSTSLNKAGQPNLLEPLGLEDYFGDLAPELVVQVGPLAAQPSQIIDLRNPGEPVAIR